MKKIFLLLAIIVLMFSCRINNSIPDEDNNLIPAEARLVKEYTDPITIAWDYIPEEGVTEYSFEFLMCLVSDTRTEENITILDTTTFLEYGSFTLKSLDITEVTAFGVRATENGIASEAIWTDKIEDTEGGTFYADIRGLWLYNEPANIGVK